MLVSDNVARRGSAIHKGVAPHIAPRRIALTYSHNDSESWHSLAAVSKALEGLAASRSTAFAVSVCRVQGTWILSYEAYDIAYGDAVPKYATNV